MTLTNNQVERELETWKIVSDESQVLDFHAELVQLWLDFRFRFFRSKIVIVVVGCFNVKGEWNVRIDPCPQTDWL